MFYRQHKRVTLDCGGPEKSLAKQEFRDECDINWIVEKYGPREMQNLSGPRAPMFGDFTNVEDYATASEMVQDALEAFRTLPADLRAVHGNDPQTFLAWFDQADAAALREAGLLPPEAEEAPVEAPPRAAEPPDGPVVT